jgi:hypothetical protein
LFGKSQVAENANIALVEILRDLSARNPHKIESLALAVRGSSRNHIARTVEEIYPARPDLARAVEFAPGWLVGLNIANREKLSIIRTACDVFEVKYGLEVKIDMPNADK